MQVMVDDLDREVSKSPRHIKVLGFRRCVISTMFRMLNHTKTHLKIRRNFGYQLLGNQSLTMQLCTYQVFGKYVTLKLVTGNTNSSMRTN